MTDAALKSTAAWILFHLARARTTNVAHKRRTQNAGNSILGDDSAQLMRGYSQQRQIKQTKFSGQTLLLNGDPWLERPHSPDKTRVASRILRAIVPRTRLFLRFVLRIFRWKNRPQLRGMIDPYT